MNSVILASIIVAFLFDATFFLSLALIHQSNTKKLLNICNTFIFEETPGFKEKNTYLNYLHFFAVMVWLFPFIFYAANNVNSYPISLMIIAVLAAFCLATLPFIPLNKLREHFYLDLGALVTLLALFGLEAFYCYRVYDVYLNGKGLAGMIVAISVIALLLVPIFNPKLFDLKNNKNEDGTYSRKNFIFLAFTEWMLYPIALISLLPIFLITMA